MIFTKKRNIIENDDTAIGEAVIKSIKKLCGGFGLLIAGIIVFTMCTFTVKENQYKVITRMGRVYKVLSEAGLYFKVPFIDKSTSISKCMHLYDIKPSDVITRDKKSMIEDSYILWQVTDPLAFFQTLGASETSGNDRVGVAVYNATKNTISSMTQDELIAARGDALAEKITTMANSDIGAYGIKVLTAEIKALDLPDQNRGSVYERMISERENIAASYTANGEREAKKITNDADKEATIIKAEAQKKADVLVAEGESEYMRILSEAYNTEDKANFYTFMRGLDALKESLKGSGEKTVILDKNSPLVKALYGD